MAARTCSGCGFEMGYSDTYCRVCGRFQMPDGGPPREGERIGLGAMLLWIVGVLTVLALVAWLAIRLGGL
jgi:hypothetical protein